MKKELIYKIVKLAVYSALTIILNIIEIYINIQIPGLPPIHLGLSNIFIVLSLYEYGLKESLLIGTLKCLAVYLLAPRGIYVFLMSIISILISIIVMYLLKKIKIIHMIVVSLFGSLSFTFGQLLVAYLLITSEASIFLYLPLMSIISIITGIIIGIISSILYKYTLKLDNKLLNI